MKILNSFSHIFKAWVCLYGSELVSWCLSNQMSHYCQKWWPVSSCFANVICLLPNNIPNVIPHFISIYTNSAQVITYISLLLQHCVLPEQRLLGSTTDSIVGMWKNIHWVLEKNEQTHFTGLFCIFVFESIEKIGTQG